MFFSLKNKWVKEYQTFTIEKNERSQDLPEK